MKDFWSRPYLSLGCTVIMLALLAAPAAGAMGSAMGGVDISGNNIRNIVVATKEECSAACDAESSCAAATFVLPGTIQGPDGHCYLKSASTPQTDNFNCYSFVKLTALPMTVGCILSYPSADFGMLASGNKPPRGFAPLVVQFTDQSTGAAGWSWDFGDGSAVSHEKNPVHTYTTGSPDGSFYDVTLTVTGSCPGETSTKKKSQIIRIFDNIGFLGLASTPGGASVYIDGSLVAGTTSAVPGDEPLRLTPGSHTVRLTLDGYQDYTGTVTVVNNVVTQLSPALVKNPSGPVTTPASSPSTTGSLSITTTPAGAAVAVDGGSRGTTPLTVSGLAAGSHTVTLTSDGYTEYQGTLTLSSGQTTQLNIALVPLYENPAATASSTQDQVHDKPATDTPPPQTLSGTISPSTAAPSGPVDTAGVPSTQKKSPGFAVPVSLAALALFLLVLHRTGKSG